MKKRVILSSVTILGIALTAFAATPTTSNVDVPLNFPIFVPCADGGAGEVVDLSGTLHVLNHVTMHDDGRVTIVLHAQPKKLKGVGATTGDKYQGTGATLSTTTVAPGGFPFTETFVNNFRMIGQGKGNNLLVHATVHTTVNANGTTTSEVDVQSFDCK